ASGLGANLLLNIGPMPNGDIQPEFKERLAYMGKWLQTYGETIYGTKGGYIRPQDWGAITRKDGKIFIHVLKAGTSSVVLENFPYKKITKAYLFKDGSPITATLKKGIATITLPQAKSSEPDIVIALDVVEK
ncbi:MAG TPA: alpha-L-fucosidase, partial [Bacteroidales bacterium]|nr:alpha-L-fucosidase [Bacteroidales bacterium]